MEWVALIEERHGISPWVFLVLYGVTLPPGWYGTWRAAAALRRRDVVGARRWAMLVMVMVVIPYAYVLAAGRNLPGWVYPSVAVLVGLSAWEVVARVRKLGRGRGEGGEARS